MCIWRNCFIPFSIWIIGRENRPWTKKLKDIILAATRKTPAREAVFTTLSSKEKYKSTVFIDTFTKQVGMVKLKTKDTKIVTQMMKYRFDNGDKPKYLRVDAGGEFLSHIFTQMCETGRLNNGEHFYLFLKQIDRLN